MAFCPHCRSDNPIKRQTLSGVCVYCGETSITHNDDNPVYHKAGCRGPTVNMVDVCSYCDTAVFASARTESEYREYERHEDSLRQQREAEKQSAESAREQSLYDSLKAEPSQILIGLLLLWVGTFLWAPPWRPHFFRPFRDEVEVWHWLVWCSFGASILSFFGGLYLLLDYLIYLSTGSSFDQKRYRARHGSHSTRP